MSRLTYKNCTCSTYMLYMLYLIINIIVVTINFSLLSEFMHYSDVKGLFIGQ